MTEKDSGAPMPTVGVLLVPVLLALAMLSAPGCGGRTAAVDAHAEEREEDHADHHEDGGGADALELTRAMVYNTVLETSPVERRVLLPELETTGRIGFNEERVAHVAPRIPGRVETVFARLGDDVAAGTVLAVIDSVPLGMAQADYLEARAAEALARRNLARERGLREEEIASEKDYLAALAAHEEARARLDATRQTLLLYGLSEQEIDALEPGRKLSSLLKIRAPMSGRIVRRHAAVGELVGPESSIFTIADLGSVWIWIDVYERDLRHVHRGDLVRVHVDAWPDSEFRGVVAYLSDVVDEDTRTVRARLDVRNHDARLRSGMFARIRISDPHARPDAEDASPVLVVPNSALQRDGEDTVVFVRTGPRTFERRVIRTGIRTADYVAVLEGLSEGEQVVVEGAFLLKSEQSKERLEPGHGHCGAP